MNLPIISVKLDKELDKQNFIEFFEAKNPMIFKYYPNLKNIVDIEQTINDKYAEKIDEILHTKKYLEEQKSTLNKIAIVLSQMMECDWGSIKQITISPSACPVCPRFIETNSFLVAYFFNQKSIIRICAHEISHFLYFKKLKEIFPNKNIDTEYPSKDWLLSEIIAPILINQDRLQKYINQKDEFYSPDSGRLIEEQKLIENLFKETKNFSDFVKTSYSIIETS